MNNFEVMLNHKKNHPYPTKSVCHLYPFFFNEKPYLLRGFYPPSYFIFFHD